MGITDTQLVAIVAVVAVLIVAAVAAVIASRRAKRRHLALKERFGPEYDRTVNKLGPRSGERVLERRVRHREKAHIRELSDAERVRFTNAWGNIQSIFVDDPKTAVDRANVLIKEVMRARGYSANEGFEQRAADLSVDHPEVVEHYRAAHALARASDEETSTEDLRQAIVHYRVIFGDLLQAKRATPVMRAPSLSHA